MLNVKKTFALAIISLFIGLIAYSTAASITSSTNATNGTNFTLNLSGQPAMDNFSTIVCGVNMTCSQNSTPDNHTIFINSLGAGGGGSGTVTQLNQGAGITLSPNPITTTGTIKINGSACNPANQASVLNGSGGLECVSNIDTGIGAEVDPFSVHWNVFANAVHNNESETQFNANYSNIVNVTNNSYVLRNQTWSRQNTTFDQNLEITGYGIRTYANNNDIYLNSYGHVITVLAYGHDAIIALAPDQFWGAYFRLAPASKFATLQIWKEDGSATRWELGEFGTSDFKVLNQELGGKNAWVVAGDFSSYIVFDNFTVYRNGSIKVNTWVGTGNRPLCVNATGMSYPSKIDLSTGLCV